MRPEFERTLVLETVQVTEQAPLAANQWVGKGNKDAGGVAGINALHSVLYKIGIRGRAVISDG